MRVRMGWSGETEPNTWQKVDIELEEQDLLRMMQQNDLPAGIQDRLPTKVCYRLLQNEAEMMLLDKLQTVGYPPDKAAPRLAALITMNNQIVDSIKKMLTPA
jgi:hypothetical protein